MKRFLLYTVPVLASFAALVGAVWGRGQAARADELALVADEYVGLCVDSCARCAEELSGSVDEMRVSLSKLRVTASDSGRILALEDIVRESAEAQAFLSRIPGSQVKAMELTAFLTRAGDYARTLSKKLLSGGGLDEEDIRALDGMLSSCESLNGLLCERIASGSMPCGTEEFDYYDLPEGSGAEDGPSEPEYPTLIYDGPFSEATERLEPRGLTGGEASPEEAAAEARRLFGEGFSYEGRTEGKLPTYDFSDEEGRAYLSLSVRGLHAVRWMSGPSGEKEGVPGEAEYGRLVSAAEELLERLGYDAMRPTCAQYYGGGALISFVREEEGVLIYNDLVKVTVDRETFEPIGLDARNYLFSHTEREIPEPVLTPSEAERRASPELSAESVGLALIPLTPQTEALCYELHGSLGGSDYVVFVNALTGEEEQILIVVSDGNGVSTL